VTELAFKGMVCCINHGRGINHRKVKPSLEKVLSFEYDSASVRMLCAAVGARSTGIFVVLHNADSFSRPNEPPLNRTSMLWKV
jgi:hypothetical protein